MINLHWRGPIDEAHPLYSALDAFDRKFLLPDDILCGSHVPGLLILAKIRGISIELIPHIISRAKIIEGNDYIDRLNKWLDNNNKPPLPEYLVRFCGVASNLDSLSTTEFAKHVMRMHNIDQLTRSQIECYLNPAKG